VKRRSGPTEIVRVVAELFSKDLAAASIHVQWWSFIQALNKLSRSFERLGWRCFRQRCFDEAKGWVRLERSAPPTPVPRRNFFGLAWRFGQGVNTGNVGQKFFLDGQKFFGAAIFVVGFRGQINPAGGLNG
jgi:hypothetical protein